MHDDYPSELGPDAPPSRRSLGILASGYLFWIFLLPVLVFGGILLILIFAGSTAPTTSKSSRPGQVSETGLDTARLGLTRQTDLKACRNALQQINAEFGDKPALRPPALTDEQKTWLRDHLHLSDKELNEVESNHYTPLDHYHLVRCFLMRDAASALEIKGVRDKVGGQVVREKPLDQAARAFAWVMREVRLRPNEGEPAPPSFVVRRGWGSALERALIFLALLEQLGDPDAPQPELLGCTFPLVPAGCVCGHALLWLVTARKSTCSIRIWACRCLVRKGRASPR